MPYRYTLAVTDVKYEFRLKFNKRRRGYKISTDRMEFTLSYRGLEKGKEKLQEGVIKITQSNEGGKLKQNVESLPSFHYPIKRLYPFFSYRIPKKTLMIQGIHVPSVFRAIPNVINFSIYDFDPKLSKTSIPLSGKAELEHDGRNLAIVLKNVLNNLENKRKFSNLLQDILPHMADFKVEGQADKSLFFKVKEKYYPRRFLPASLISEGTISVMALILALFFDTKTLNVIEEPERNLHPYLLARVINMMKNTSIKKQIIITTHNPEVVRQAGLDNLLLVKRDKEGFSTMTKPSELVTVRRFLADEMDLSELYIQNLLAG